MSSVFCLFILSSYPQHLPSELTFFTGFRVLSFLNVIELELQYATFSNGFLHLVTSIYFPPWSFYILLFIFKSSYNISKVTFHLQCFLFLSFFFFFFLQNVGPMPCFTLYILEFISHPVVCAFLSPTPRLLLPPSPLPVQLQYFRKEATHWKRPWC